ncbi:MAG: hypothetical protein ACYDCL_11745 [Myxococcales bacterium]
MFLSTDRCLSSSLQRLSSIEQGFSKAGERRSTLDQKDTKVLGSVIAVDPSLRGPPQGYSFEIE